jgi:hypothetical protein
MGMDGERYDAKQVALEKAWGRGVPTLAASLSSPIRHCGWAPTCFLANS